MICERLHEIFNGLERHHFPFDQSSIPENGIYVLFEKGERAHGEWDRIVRIGTHTGQGNLPKRLIEHFMRENKDRSIFRKNIGRALLRKEKDAFAEQWEIDLTSSDAKRRYSGKINSERLSEMEKNVSAVIRSTFAFCVFPVEDKQQRLDLEKRIIATVNHCAICGPSKVWLGSHSPKEQIRRSGLWLIQGLNGCMMDREELKMLQKMTSKVEPGVPPDRLRSQGTLCYDQEMKRRNSMQFNQIEAITIRILQNADERFLFPYQIFNRIRQLDPPLSKQIEAAYATKPGNPPMGEGAGVYYSAASFVSKALNKFKNKYPEIKKEWVDSNDIKIEGIIAGNKDSTSIWAWKDTE